MTNLYRDSFNRMPLHSPNNIVAFRTIVLKKKENYDSYFF